MTEPKRYVTCEYHHPSCLPGWGHFEADSCVNPVVAVVPPGVTEFPIQDRFPTKDDGPGGAIRLAPPDELRKREVLDEIEMAKRFVRPGLYHGANPRAEVMAWMDYADALEADLKSATNSYRQLRESLNRLREWYNDSQAELQITRNALGDLLARITLGECPLCGAIPAQAHDGGCPVPKALEIWDMLPDDSRRWAEAREQWRNDPGYGDNEPAFIQYLTDHGFEFEA